MKTFKKFCLDLTTVALPSLIGNDLVIVYPLKSRTGYLQYLQFTAGSNKGGVKQGDVFNDVFALGDMNESRENYTALRVVEPFRDAGTSAFVAAWTPVVKGVFENGGTKYDVKVTSADGSESYKNFDNDGKTITSYTPAAGDKVAYCYDNVIIPQSDIPQLTARMEGIELAAKARRIAIYYSQMAA